MLKRMDKKIFAILRSKFLLNWLYDLKTINIPLFLSLILIFLLLSVSVYLQASFACGYFDTVLIILFTLK